MEAVVCAGDVVSAVVLAGEPVITEVVIIFDELSNVVFRFALHTLRKGRYRWGRLNTSQRVEEIQRPSSARVNVSAYLLTAAKGRLTGSGRLSRGRRSWSASGSSWSGSGGS